MFILAHRSFFWGALIFIFPILIKGAIRYSLLQLLGKYGETEEHFQYTEQAVDVSLNIPNTCPRTFGLLQI